jgi:hypothetical protein
MAKESIDQITSRLEDWFEQDKNARSNVDWQWFTYDLFYSGNHYARWDRDTQQIVTSAKDAGRPKLTINKIYATCRNVANWVMRSDPKAEVTPDDLTPDNLDDALIATKYLDYLHDKLRLKNKLRQSLKQALRYSVGYWKVVWDEEKQEVDVQVVHPYDLYWDSTARTEKEARRLTVCVRRPLSYLQNNPLYDQEAVNGVRPDGKLAESDIYSRFLAHDRGMSTNGSQADTVIVKEHWYYGTDKKDRDTIYVAATANGVTIRKPEATDLTELPFFVLRSDVEPLQMYGEGWIKNMIDPQKMLNRGESNIAEYNDLINKVKIVIDRGAGVRTINNQHGQIIEKKKGFNIQPLSPAPMSSVQLNQITNAMQYMEDLGAMHDASLGRIPIGAKSGAAIEALQFGDSMSLSELSEGMQTFLMDVYEYILSLVSQKYQFVREIKPTTRTGEREFLKIIGEDAEVKPDDATVIKKKNMVDVKIGSYLAYTPQARQEAIRELASTLAAIGQPLDVETILDAYGVGGIADVISRMRKQKQEQMRQERQQQVGPEQGAEQALAAIRSIVQGQAPDVPNNPNRDYVDTLSDFIDSPEAQNLDPQQIRAMQTLRDRSIQFAGQIGIPEEA